MGAEVGSLLGKLKSTDYFQKICVCNSFKACLQVTDLPLSVEDHDLLGGSEDGQERFMKRFMMEEC